LGYLDTGEQGSISISDSDSILILLIPQICSLALGRDAIGCALLGDRLIVVGGYDGNHALKSVEEYDPVRNGWNELAPMGFARADPLSFLWYLSLEFADYRFPFQVLLGWHRWKASSRDRVEVELLFPTDHSHTLSTETKEWNMAIRIGKFISNSLPLPLYPITITIPIPMPTSPCPS